MAIAAELKPNKKSDLLRVNFEGTAWNLDPNKQGDSLFLEALVYKSLKLIDVGQHISCFIVGAELHIHFRRNLDQIKPVEEEKKSDFELAKEFSDRIGANLAQLSKLFANNDPRFENVKTIVGLTGLGAVWGRRHGWETELYTQDPIAIKLHESTIENKPMETQPTKLTIFTISREQHILSFPPLSIFNN